MKCVMTGLASVAVLAAMTLCSTGEAHADYLAVKYRAGKMSGCRIKFEYYDGDTKKITCSVTDDQARSSSKDYVHLQCGDGHIRHLDHQSSGIVISVSRTSASACNDTDLAVVRAKKTAGKDKTKTADDFYASPEELSGTDLREFFDDRVHPNARCYRRVNTKRLSDSPSVRIRVRFEQKKEPVDGGLYNIYCYKSHYFQDSDISP